MFRNVFKPGIRELARTGRKLASELDDLAATMHTKSEDYNVLVWEADILRAKAEDIESKCGVIPNLRKSVLLPSSSRGVFRTYSELLDQVRAFHTAYDEQA